jgi:hypothetical protein
MADTVEVPSRETWVATPVTVEPGQVLHFRAEGTWWDAVIPCSADGYPAPFFYALGRPPRIPDDGRYFRLMGRVVADDAPPATDDPSQTFVIGRQSEWTTPQRGRLYVFANDAPGFYWNNWGSVTLTITL